jgi:transcriptional regulator with XRE-family HTH domain
MISNFSISLCFHGDTYVNSKSYICDLQINFWVFTFVPLFKTVCYIFIIRNMKERLLKIITSEGLTPSSLADEIGVQRSGISHILSGRNYPSFDFLQKLLDRYPKLNAEWLIMGHGSMYKSALAEMPDLFAKPAPDTKAPDPPAIPEKLPDLPSGESHQKRFLETKSEIFPSAEPKKTIEKMIVLYSDKTFATYLPECLS